MAVTAPLADSRRIIADRHALPDNRRGALQVLTTALPIAALWALVIADGGAHGAVTIAATALLALFLLRVFVLMHDCGHGSLFRSPGLNRGCGFAFGVLAAIPQFVWSQNHQFHHSTNGNWSRYRGPLNIIAADEYAAMSAGRQRRYRNLRAIWLAPLGGLLYLLVWPRVNLVRASAALVRQRWRARRTAAPGAAAGDFHSPVCASLQSYAHMFWNNVGLLLLWVVLALAAGPGLFLFCYLVSLALAGGLAIVLFTVQHNFECSYASADEGWDPLQAAVEGTSLLVLPGWLNWFTADIAYHHVHHLCARVPNYHLAACHRDMAHLFTAVRRIHLRQIPAALRCILWDTHGRRIISVAEHRRQSALKAAA